MNEENNCHVDKISYGQLAVFESKQRVCAKSKHCKGVLEGGLVGNILPWHTLIRILKR